MSAIGGKADIGLTDRSFELSQISQIRTVISLIALVARRSRRATGMSEAPLIAIVDDDELARDGMRELVDSLGYRGVSLTTCLITDLQMPGLNGLELQEALRSSLG